MIFWIAVSLVAGFVLFAIGIGISCHAITQTDGLERNMEP